MKLGRIAVALILMLLVQSFLISTANAAMVRFVGVDSAAGFYSGSPSFPTVPDLDISPDGESFSAGPTGSGADIIYSIDHCLLANGVGDCQSSIVQGTAYTDLVTLTLESVPPAHPIPNEGLYVLFAGMQDTGYTVSDVWFDTDGSLVGGIQTDPLLFALHPDGLKYFGFRFSAFGESKTVKYEVNAMQASTPEMFTAAYYPVPEPGTASLVMLGLATFAVVRRR